MSRCHRTVVGFLAAGALSLPLVASAVVAAPKKPAPKKPAAPAKGDAKLGKEAFKKEGCTGCHVTKDFPDAGKAGPDLSAVAQGHTAAQISAYIKKPKAGSIMPAYKGPAKSLADMTAYMMTQKG